MVPAVTATAAGPAPPGVLPSAADLANHDFCVAKLKALPAEALRPRPILTGHDLMGLGVPQGPRVGDLIAVRLTLMGLDAAEADLRSAVALAEPLMLFFIAAFIGTIFIGMVIPIFSLQDHIK